LFIPGKSWPDGREAGTSTAGEDLEPGRLAL
jgi:hypothetical protein